MKEHIKDISLFSEFNDDDLSIIDKYFELKTFEKDDVIIKNKDNKKRLFILIKGKVESSRSLPDKIDRKHGIYGPGDFFGEISLFGNKPAFDTYCAVEKSEMLTLHENDLLGLMENSSDIAVTFIFKLLNMTIQRLRDSSKFLADVVQWGEDASRRVITDELTGVYNRLFLDDALTDFFKISVDNSKPLSLIMMDIDNFRTINDTVGIDTANKIIFKFVSLVKAVVSKHGIIARYGGDEFSILLPEADLEKAVSIAEQIRSEVENNSFSEFLNKNECAVTTSLGISCYPETATDLDSFKEKADASLYRAKEMGKNRVVSLD